MILKTMALEPKHGWASAKRIQQISGEVLQVQQGSLYPASNRLEQRGWTKAKWKETGTGRRALLFGRRTRPARKGNRGLEPPFRSNQSGRGDNLVSLAVRAECCGRPYKRRRRREEPRFPVSSRNWIACGVYRARARARDEQESEFSTPQG
ncbi:MAG TPA: helix-turn-helix transcriptional regulator, partial [Candidatus Acidoferrum sp.]